MIRPYPPPTLTPSPDGSGVRRWGQAPLRCHPHRRKDDDRFHEVLEAEFRADASGS